MTYLPRVATVTLRALNGVSQLVLIWASTPEAVRNCKSAISSRSATALESCGCTSTMSDSVNQRIRSMSCTARSITTPTLDIRGGNGPTRVIPIDRISSFEIACLIAATAGLNRSTWPTIKVTPACLAGETISRASLTAEPIDRAAAGQFGGACAMRRQRIDDSDQCRIRQTGQHARMVGAHDPRAD